MKFGFFLLLFSLLWGCSSIEEIHLGALQHFNRGNEFLEQRLYKQAIHEYQAAIALEDDQEVYHYNLGLSYFHLMLYEKAQEAYLEAIELNPKFAEAWYNLSLAYNKLDKPDEAYMAYEKYQTLNRQAAEKKPVKEAPKVLAGPNMPASEPKTLPAQTAP